MFIAHNITAAQGGTILGVYDDYTKAKNDLKKYMGWGEQTTDWGHFIRICEVNKPFGDCLCLPRTDKDGNKEKTQTNRKRV